MSDSSSRLEQRFNDKSIEELQEEFAEFKLTSQALEAELEAELAETEERTQQLEQELSSARKDVEYWRLRAEKNGEEATRAQQQLAEQMDCMREAAKRTQDRLIAAERDNDDMERNGRETEAYVHELAQQNASLLEQLAIAEAEAREKISASEELQRVREDLRDANDEISRLQSARPASSSSHSLVIPKSQSLRRVAGILDQVAVLEGHVATVRKRLGSEGSRYTITEHQQHQQHQQKQPAHHRGSGTLLNGSRPLLDLRNPTAVGHGRGSFRQNPW